MPNQRVAKQIYEEHGEVGFWYFYKDALLTHFENIKANAYDGPRYIYQGTVIFALGVLMLVFLIIAPILFPLTKIRKARKASEEYNQWLEKRK